MIALTHVVRTGSRAAGASAAAALAALALTRVAFGWVVTILLVVWSAWWLVRRDARSRRLVAVHAGALALCVPWLAYTYSVTGRPFLWGTSGSSSLYWMSSPYAVDRGDWHCAVDVFRRDWLAPHRPFFLAHADDTPVEQDLALERQARRNIVGHPAKYLENIAANASRIFFNAPYSNRPLEPKAIVFIVPGALLLGLLALAVGRFATRRRRLPPEGPAFALLAAASLAVHLPLSAYVRMLIPMVPPLLWLIVQGLRAASPDADGADRTEEPDLEVEREPASAAS
jgi:hypothetical protein